MEAKKELKNLNETTLEELKRVNEEKKQLS